MFKLTEEQKEVDRERGKEAYVSNHTKTYQYKNRGLEIKMEEMEMLHKRFKELDETIEGLEPAERLQTLSAMAEIGKAVIPD